MLSRSNAKPLEGFLSFNPQDNSVRLDYFYLEISRKWRLKFSEVKPKMTKLFALLINHHNNVNKHKKSGSYLLNYCHVVDNVRCSVYMISLNPSISSGGKCYCYHSIQLHGGNTITITLPFQMAEWRPEEAE